jgi:copper chaperone CopZ
MELETIRIKTTGMPGVAEARADVAASMTEVTFDPGAVDAAALVDAIEKAGYGAEVAS